MDRAAKAAGEEPIFTILPYHMKKSWNCHNRKRSEKGLDSGYLHPCASGKDRRISFQKSSDRQPREMTRDRLQRIF